MAAKNLKIRPLDDRVVVEPVEAEERTAGGIVLPDSAKEKPQRGHVLGHLRLKRLDSGGEVDEGVGVREGFGSPGALGRLGGLVRGPVEVLAQLVLDEAVHAEGPAALIVGCGDLVPAGERALHAVRVVRVDHGQRLLAVGLADPALGRDQAFSSG